MLEFDQFGVVVLLHAGQPFGPPGPSYVELLMSIALSASIRAADPERNQLPRQVFPVGARFPRHTNETESASMNSAATVPAARIPDFPVGARFPRRSDIDVAIY